MHYQGISWPSQAKNLQLSEPFWIVDDAQTFLSWNCSPRIGASSISFPFNNEFLQLGRVFKAEFEDTDFFMCKNCRTHISLPETANLTTWALGRANESEGVMSPCQIFTPNEKTQFFKTMLVLPPWCNFWVCP